MPSTNEAILEINLEHEETTTPGDIAVREYDDRVEVEEAEANAEATRTAMQDTSLIGNGPSFDAYDYEAAHRDGQGFAKDDDGGFTLKNRYARPRRYGIAGYDMATGERVIDNGLSAEPGSWVRAGVDRLRDSHTNTVSGTPEDDVASLARIALGYQDLGYENYMADIGPLHHEKGERAWNAAEAVVTRVELERDMESAAAGAGASGKPPPEVSFDPSNLSRNQAWLDAAATVREWIGAEEPYPSLEAVGEPEQRSKMDLVEWSLEFMSSFANNLPAMGAVVAKLAGASDKQKQAMLDLLTMYDEVPDLDAGVFWRAVKNYGLDPSTYAAAGIGGWAGKRAGRHVARGWIKRGLFSSGAGGAEEATLSAGKSASQSMVVKGEVDAGDLAIDTAIGAGAGIVGGAVLGEAMHQGVKAAAKAVRRKRKKK